MPIKITFDDVLGFFDKQGCKLLEHEYLGVFHKMNYVCNCGNVAQISFQKFKAGQRCSGCKNKRLSASKKLSYEEVRSYFEEQGCILLDSMYEHSRTKMKYVCICGKHSTITYNKFKNGSRCKECGVKKSTSKTRFTIEDAKNYFANHNCELLDESYVNARTKMNYKCKCGNLAQISFDTFKKGVRCKHCGIEKMSESRTLNYDYVKDYFVIQDCLLLEEEYINAHTPMKYMCDCGGKHKINFNNFKNGQRCVDCKIKNGSGENSPSWLGGITELNNYLRNSTLTNTWRKESMFKCNYQCVITNNKKDFEVHHLYPFHKIVKQTIEILNMPIYDLVNKYTQDELKIIEKTFNDIHSSYGLGVILNKQIHEAFHLSYGRLDFTPEDFEEFKIYHMNT